MQNGNTLLTTWSQEDKGTQWKYYQHFYRSYELIDGVFMPVSTLALGDSGHFARPEIMSYNNDILIDVSNTGNLIDISGNGAYVKTYNRSLTCISNTYPPYSIAFAKVFHAVIDKKRKRILAIGDMGTVYGYYSGSETSGSGNGFGSDTGYKNDWIRFFVINYDDNGSLSIGGDSWKAPKSNIIFTNFGLKYGSIGLSSKINSYAKLFSISPDMRFLTYPTYMPAATGISIFDTKNEEYPIKDVAGYTNYKAYVIDGNPDVIVGTMPNLLEWTADSRYFITANSGTTNSMRVYRQIDNKFTEVSTITNIPRNVYALVASPDNRSLAVVVTGAKTSYDTLIYRRKGDEFSLVQTLDNFGVNVNYSTSLAFNGDGSLLIDVNSRRAFRMDMTGTFNEDKKVMSRVVAGATVCKLSDHILQPPVSGFIYDNTVPYVVNNPNIDLNLKFCLLSSSAEFHHEHKSIKDVTGENANQSTTEVSGFGWPVGGKKIENAAFTKVDNSSVILNGDNMSVDIAGGALKFSKAVIYNETTMEPWLWFDFGNEITIESNTTVNINFSNRGFLIFTP